jgi:hypothetical protein
MPTVITRNHREQISTRTIDETRFGTRGSSSNRSKTGAIALPPIFAPPDLGHKARKMIYSWCEYQSGSVELKPWDVNGLKINQY